MKTQLLAVGLAFLFAPAAMAQTADELAPASVEQAAGSGDCDNPCRAVPYTPKNR